MVCDLILILVGLQSATALATIVVRKAALDESGELRDVIFKRSLPIANKDDIVEPNGDSARFPIQEVPSLSLPPPHPDQGNDNATLVLTLGAEPLGSGRVAFVHGVDIDMQHSLAQSPEIHDKVIPHLVAKISKHHSIAADSSEALSHDAFCHAALEDLQGVVIARYFGFYEAKLPAHWRFIPWRIKQSIDNDYPQCTCENCQKVAKQRDEEVYPPNNESHKISLMLLERLGNTLPKHNNLDDARRLRCVLL